MRELKFRAWDKPAKEMFEVTRLYFGDYGLAGTILVQRKIKAGVANLTAGESCELMQFTGLKDKNGTEVYEGDIVRGLTTDEHTGDILSTDNFVVEFEPPEFCLLHKDGTPSTLDEDCEIIGNVWENPELIKGGKNELKS